MKTDSRGSAILNAEKILMIPMGEGGEESSENLTAEMGDVHMVVVEHTRILTAMTRISGFRLLSISEGGRCSILLQIGDPRSWRRGCMRRPSRLERYKWRKV